MSMQIGAEHSPLQALSNPRPRKASAAETQPILRTHKQLENILKPAQGKMLYQTAL